jgi:AcrR family transcriptional regulator
MAADIRSDLRAEGRVRMREAMLDAACQTVVAEGWASVRMGRVATRVGVSRQTLYTQFATKDALGQALVLREADRFLALITTTLDEHPDDVVHALRHAATQTLELLAANPLLQAILAESVHASDETLLPMLTSRGQPLVHRAGEVVTAWLQAHSPQSDPALVTDLVDSVVRLVVSHSLMPVDPPDVVGDRLARIVASGLSS